MRCPTCEERDTRVVDSRDLEDAATIRRRRECVACGARFTTYERMEAARLVVVKRDGVRQEFDRDKLAAGIRKALTRRPVPDGAAERAADEIEAILRAAGATEVGVLADRRAGDGAAAGARPDRLHPLRQRLPVVRGPRDPQARGRLALRRARARDGGPRCRERPRRSRHPRRARGRPDPHRALRPRRPAAVVGRPPPRPQLPGLPQQPLRVHRPARGAAGPDRAAGRPRRRAVHPAPGRVRPRPDDRVGGAARRTSSRGSRGRRCARHARADAVRLANDGRPRAGRRRLRRDRGTDEGGCRHASTAGTSMSRGALLGRNQGCRRRLAPVADGRQERTPTRASPRGHPDDGRDRRDPVGPRRAQSPRAARRPGAIPAADRPPDRAVHPGRLARRRDDHQGRDHVLRHGDPGADQRRRILRAEAGVRPAPLSARRGGPQSQSGHGSVQPQRVALEPAPQPRDARRQVRPAPVPGGRHRPADGAPPGLDGHRWVRRRRGRPLRVHEHERASRGRRRRARSQPRVPASQVGRQGDAVWRRPWAEVQGEVHAGSAGLPSLPEG